MPASSERTKRDVGNSDEALSETVPKIPDGALLAGRYLVLRRLGRGGFSDVYLAHDHELDRSVAVKRLLLSDIDPHFIKDEAKTLASLDHPGIVRIYDICDEPKYGYLVIMQFVPGPMLREVLVKPLSINRAVEIAIRVSGGLIHAHSRGVVHRDIKPSNILMSNEGEPLIADFGLAFAPTSHCNPEGGTPRYMSPEQIRNETKRIGPSSDIFSTGVLLYEMLAGCVPFNGETAEAVSQATLEKSPTSINEINPNVPLELDRIVRRALRKNVKDRYSSMDAFQAELIHWLSKSDAKDELSTLRTPDWDRNSSLDSTFASSLFNSLGQFTHRGLQPFESDDAKFFLSLVPGARAPSGLPESVQYWKDWIEAYDDSEYGRIGILYGPSGSGKTSLLRAGIIPHLSPDLLPISIECRKGESIAQIAAQIAGQADVAYECEPEGLTALLVRLRDDYGARSEHRKVVLCFDQFDNWAGSAKRKQLAQLAAALRHCDGLSLQAVLIVRDDFWTAATEFMRLVEFGVEQWRNARAIELFDRHHTRRLLEAAGRALGSLPPNPEALDADQNGFINHAIEEMSVKGRVLPIQFAMFAKMAKLQRWHPDTLAYAGGVQGAYVGYFQDLFESATAPPAYQRVCGAVVEVLHRLIPDADQTAHSHQIEFSELERTLTEKKLQNQLHRVLNILVEDLRIVVRISQPASESPSEAAIQCNDRFHLVHDFLTSPISEWVAQVRKSSWRGKAAARLEELSAMWGRKQHSRYLPTLLEFAAIHAATPVRKRSLLQKRFLHSAGKMYLMRAVLTLAVLAPISLIATWSLRQHQRNVAEHRKQVVQRVEGAIHGEAKNFISLLNNLRDDKATMSSALQPWLDSADEKYRTRTRLLSTAIHKTSFELLKSELGEMEPQFSKHVIEVAKQCSDAKQLLRDVIHQAAEVNVEKIRAAVTLANLGDTKPLEAILDDKNGPSLTNSVFNHAMDWDVSPSFWIDLLKSRPSPAVTYYSLCFLGSYPQDSLPADLPWDIIENLKASSDGGVVATANWLLERNHVGRNLLGSAESLQHRVLSTGQKLVRLEAGRTEHEVRVPGLSLEDAIVEVSEPFWISRAAVTNREFAIFLKEAEIAENLEIKPIQHSERRHDELEGNPDRAVTGLNLLVVLKYCNWLSEREKLTPVYKIHSSDLAAFQVIDDANGFRLPTYAQAIYCASFGLHRSTHSRISVKAFRKSRCLKLDATEEDFYKIDRLANGLMPNRAGVQFDHDAYQLWATAENSVFLLNSASPSGDFAAFKVSDCKPRHIGGLWLVSRCQDRKPASVSFSTDITPTEVLLDSEPPHQSR